MSSANYARLQISNLLFSLFIPIKALTNIFPGFKISWHAPCSYLTSVRSMTHPIG